MRISHQHKLIFLATPRTGSTTIRSILDQYSDVKSVHVTKVTREFPFYHHISAGELKIIFDRRGWDWEQYRKFCLVRNPYDRVVSLFHHNQKLKLAEKGFRKLLRPARELLRSTGTFRDYVMQIDPNARLTTSLRVFTDHVNGTCLVNDVLKFESLTEELPRYLHKSGIDVAEELIPHLNASKHRADYRSYYDNESRDRVVSIYGDEMERFAYVY